MRTIALLAATMLIAACKPAEAPADANAEADAAANAAAPVDANAVAAPAAMSLLNTSWEYMDDGKQTVVTIDPAGGYIANRTDGTHVDHGTYAAKNGKDCFSSAMGDKSTMCFSTVAETPVGSTAASTDDKGVSVDYKRVEFRPLTM